MNSIQKETEKSNASRDWLIYITVSVIFLIGVSIFSFFESEVDFNGMALRLFDALISCILVINGLYFMQKNKGIAVISFLLGIINLGILAVLLFR
ncbi:MULTISPECIES: hypothetical protein [Bacillus]|uniref:hypothetical protein n=1 Tax=Bacillus TaxID=1386 RepID=UPI0004A80F36|nr:MULTISPECIES: hypothetical protein [Bacillus]SLB77384.1 Uncharacterised protein [Mycobacteroides abscessus subsp. massiliense]ATU28181.1 hypothetical protein BMJ37_16075 [Bacillus velezensis]ATY29755.1 hypothetical protein CVD07_16300 [Bacillus velezensis]AUS17352.1 hypothetical protein C0W57_14710 [Bacillus velezensis]AWM45572.1 hypothetical protein BAALB65_16705 [Bacillus amyloliquefaciens]